MHTLHLDLAQNSYNICIGQDLLGNTGSYLRELSAGRKVLIVSNPTVFPLYGERVVESLQEAGYEVFTHLIPDGEEYKNMEQAMLIINTCMLHKLERKSIIIALGGGVIGDIAGFAAAIYQRGIPFIQIPTTLLAQVDSSVGGKVAVNHPQGKNMIGAFHQPKLVIIDTTTLYTLDERDYHSGLGEVCKYGIIYNDNFFAQLEDLAPAIVDKSSSALTTVIYESCRIKSEVVEQDEKETGIRAILNLGHTFGHAIESLAGYGTYRHGETVIMGTIAAGYLAMELGFLNNEDFLRIMGLFHKLNIYHPFPDLPLDGLYQAMLSDKKVANKQPSFILPRGIGNFVMVKDISEEQVIEAMGKARQSHHM